MLSEASQFYHIIAALMEGWMIVSLEEFFDE